jgi:uncharacterized repeat protein (TIGR01451 family)
MSSTHLLSRARGHASLVSRSSSAAAHHSLASSGSSLFPRFGTTSSSSTGRLLASVTGCGADGTIADASGFEDADGNLAVDNAGCTDWNSFSPAWSGNVGTDTLGGLSFVGLTDPTNSSSDSIYSGGVKQDTVCPGVTTGNVNDKADLGRIYVATETINGHVYLFLAWERQIDTTINSDVFVSFEFNQGQLACANNDGFVQRTPGDLLFDYNFQSGNSTIDAKQWDGSTWQSLTTPPFDAAVNSGTVTDTIGPNGSVDLTTFEFGEAGIDLSALNLTGNGGKACETFGSVLGGSRTSKSGDEAQLKDYVGPAPIDVSNCVSPTVTTTLKNAAGGTTIANNSSVAFGSSVYDTATLGNLIAGKTPTGTVKYTFFTNGNCSGNGTSAGTVTLDSSGNVPQSNTEGPLAAGDYSFEAQYFSGNDPNYTDSAPSACEPFSVGKAPTSLSTTVFDAGTDAAWSGSEVTGAKAYDTSSLGGKQDSIDPTGTVTYTFFSGDCATGTPVFTDQQTVGANEAVPNSKTTDSLAAGDYAFQAVYSGDSNYSGKTSDCEPFSVGKAQPSIVTKQQPASGSVGETYNDTATLSDAVAHDGTGSITFKLYDGQDCAGNVLDTEIVHNVSANGDYPTPTGFAIQNAGTYYWVATFSGDSNNLSAASGCNDEPVVVGPNGPSIATLLSSSAGNVGMTVHDSATLSGATADAGGKVTYTVYSDSECSTKFADAGTVTVANGSVPDSNPVTFNTPGTYYWQASYSGDNNNQPAVSTCTDEKLVVAPLIDLAITKSGAPASQELGQGNITWTMVVTNNGPDTATGVTISDPMPAGNTFVSATTTQGTCTGGAILNCSLGTMAAGATVTITLVTTPSAVGTQTNTVTVVGNETETNTSNNTATATVQVTGPHQQVAFCVAVSKITPKQLFVGRKTLLTIHITKHGKAFAGIKVRIKGPKLNTVTKRSNAKGIIKKTVKLKKAGILVFTPLASKRCGTKRIGVTGVFTPPVTG